MITFKFDKLAVGNFSFDKIICYSIVYTAWIYLPVTILEFDESQVVKLKYHQ